MTARPWGTTGRVTLTRHDDEGAPGYHVDHDVNVDGVFVGATCDWGVRILAEVNGVVSDTTFPSLDAAVMWVLRRADADVWRQERGPVWRVKSGRVPPDCHRCHYHWRIYAPGGSEYTYSGATDTRDGWEWALREVFYQLTGAAHRDLS